MDPMDKTNHRPQIGQSLTPDQVRNLPDGANAMMRHFRGEDVKWINSPGFKSASQISDMMESGTFIGAVLVSLPSEPSPGEGYRWVRVGETLYFEDQNLGVDGWINIKHIIGQVCEEPDTYRRRIEPQAELPIWVITCDRCGTTYKNNERHACVAKAEPAPRVASEIEKECALHALTVLMDDCHDAMTDAMSERDYDYLHDFMVAVDGTFNRYREVYSYARSIGAIE